MPIYIILVYEDALSESVLEKLLSCFGSKYNIYQKYNGRGFGYIKANINGFNQACNTNPFLVLTDLDNASCPLEIIEAWFIKPINKNMIFRVAVKEVESWLLADIEGLSSFLSVSEANFPRSPEQEIDPKNTLISLAKKSRKRNIRKDIVPINDNAQIGPNYNGRLQEFIFTTWDIQRAISRSDSLSRAYKSLENFEFSYNSK